MAYTTDDLLSAVSSQAGINALAAAVLGKDTQAKETGTQDTTATTQQGSTSTGTQDTSQRSSSTGTQSSATSGTSNQTSNTAGSSAQTSTGSSAQASTSDISSADSSVVNARNNTTTTGSTDQSTNQLSHTTGTVTNTTGGTSHSSSSTTSNADISALQEVYRRQLAGITPEALKAIFYEGSKDVPNLVATQANAAGARTAGNTPLEQVMNDLNTNLTNKAALLNMQMLSDAGTTAGKIGDLTRSTTTNTDTSNNSVETQVQDLITSTSSVTASKQLQEAINSMVQTQNTQGTQHNATNATGTQASTTVGTNSQLSTTLGSTSQLQDLRSAQDQLVVGTQATSNNTQASGTQTSATKSAKDSSTLQQQQLNTNILGNVAKALGSGVGIAALYNMAKQSGFLGKASDFIKSLISGGADLKAINTELAASGMAQVTMADLANLSSVAPQWDEAFANSVSDSVTNLGGLFNAGAGTGASNLFTSVPDVVTGDGVDVLGPIFGFADGGEVTFLPTPDLLKPAEPEKQDNSMDLSGMLAALAGGTAGASASKPASTSTTASAADPSAQTTTAGQTWETELPWNYNTVTQAGPPEWQSETNLANIMAPKLAELGYTGPTVVSDIHMGTTSVAPQLTDWLASKDAKLVGSWTDAGTIRAGVKTADGKVLGTQDVAVDNDALFGLIINAGVAAVTGGVGGGIGGAAGLSGVSAGIANGALNGAIVTGGNGGNPLAGAITGGISGGTTKVVKGKADGGQITGPGTGVSDSIPAEGPGGAALQVSHGEYIVPADTVKAVGVDFLDRLVAQTHVPAAVQRAMLGD